MSFQLKVNGVEYRADVPASTPLAQVLRDECGLRGTKLGCGQGECGACSVLMGGRVVCSCLTPVCRAAGQPITTIEGIAPNRIGRGDASVEDSLHPVQQAFIDHGALQCGFCTPGMVIAACALLARHPDPTEEQVIDGLTGNLCRCTGYRKIIDAVLDAAKRRRAT